MRRNEPEGPVVLTGPGPLFSSHLDLKEIKSQTWLGSFLNQSSDSPGLHTKLELDQEPPAALDQERTGPIFWRHFRWWGDRERVYQAMHLANQPSGRCGRFLLCGTQAYVEVSAKGDRARVVSYTCRDRFCEACLADKAFHIRRRLDALMGEGFHRTVTLTCKTAEVGLREAIGRVCDWFADLRRTVYWKETVKGGAWFIEMTRGELGDHWHAHCHAVTHGVWIDFVQLQAAWMDVTGTSKVVHVRASGPPGEASRYVSDYCTKGFGRSLYDQPLLLAEAITATKGSRLLATFGDWWGRKVEDDVPDEVGWRRVGDLTAVIGEASRGREWATALVLLLGRRIVCDGGRIRYCRPLK